MPTRLPKSGDWIKSYSSGCWQVYRVISFQTFDPVSQAAVTQVAVFSKRLWDAKKKPAFTQECCDVSFTKPLSARDADALASRLLNDEPLRTAFEQYVPAPIDAIYNARLTIPRGTTKSQIKKSLSAQAFTQPQLVAQLKKLGAWDPHGHVTAQFVSPNHEVQAGWLAYTFRHFG